MSKLTVLNSDSSGNSYIIQSNDKYLLIEAGVNIREVIKGVKFELRKVAGVIVSHSHGDHSKYIPDFLFMGIPVYSNKDVAEKYKRVETMHTCKKYDIDGFKIQCIGVPHNVPCYSFVIDTPENERILFITDTSCFKYRVKGVNILMCEANYSGYIMEKNAGEGKFSSSANRNHLSIDQAIDIIKRHDTTDLQNILLLHLSAGNSDAEMFKDMVKNETLCNCLVADAGVELELKNNEF